MLITHCSMKRIISTSQKNITTTHLKIRDGSKEQYRALHEKGIWICGNKECKHPKTGERTMITKPQNADFVEVLTPNRQKLIIEMKSIKNICKLCGAENELYQEITSSEELIERYE